MRDNTIIFVVSAMVLIAGFTGKAAGQEIERLENELTIVAEEKELLTIELSKTKEELLIKDKQLEHLAMKHEGEYYLEKYN